MGRQVQCTYQGDPQYLPIDAGDPSKETSRQQGKNPTCFWVAIALSLEMRPATGAATDTAGVGAVHLQPKHGWLAQQEPRQDVSRYLPLVLQPLHVWLQPLLHAAAQHLGEQLQQLGQTGTCRIGTPSM